MKIKEIWNAIPKFVKVGVWIGVSAGLTSILTECLNKPELFNYYGLLNFILVAINEIDKKYRREK